MTATDRPYTDDDLRAEAARQHRLHMAAFDSHAVLRHLLDAPVESTRSDSDVLTWDEALNCDDLDEPATAVRDLVQGAADVSEWAIALGADGLEPTGYVLKVGSASTQVARIHFAFAPGFSDDARASLVEGLGQVITDAL